MTTATPTRKPKAKPAQPDDPSVWHICGRGGRHDCETHPHRCRTYCGKRGPGKRWTGTGLPWKKHRCAVCWMLAELEGLFA